MKRLISLLILCMIILSGCESAAIKPAALDDDKNISVSGMDANNSDEELLKGSTETKTPFLPIANAYFKTTIASDRMADGNDALIEENQNVLTAENTLTKKTGTTSIETLSLISSNETLSIMGTASIVPTAPETHIAPTSTPTGRYIELTGVYDRRIGRAGVVWVLHGDFEHSFWVVYSETNPLPVYPADEYTRGSNTHSPFAEETVIYGTPGHTYYIRVCEKLENGTCGIYSNTKVFTLNIATATPTNTLTNNLIRLGVGPVSEGVARVTWWTEKDYPNGFEIIWSSEGTKPQYSYNPSVHANNSDRSVTVYGEPGIRYYYRICGYIGNTCDDYSASFEYIFNYKTPTLTPTKTNVPPTLIPWPPTATEVPPTNTTAPPTATEAPPTDTPVPTETTAAAPEGGGE